MSEEIQIISDSKELSNDDINILFETIKEKIKDLLDNSLICEKAKDIFNSAICSIITPILMNKRDDLEKAGLIDEQHKGLLEIRNKNLNLFIKIVEIFKKDDSLIIQLIEYIYNNYNKKTNFYTLADNAIKSLGV